jgi:putative transposase
MIDPQDKRLSLRRQCQLVGISRSRWYYHPRPESAADLQVMDWIDREFTDHPFTGVDRMARRMEMEHGVVVNPKRVRRLMRTMGLIAIYPKPRTTIPIPEHVKYPCLLREWTPDRPDQVWCSDITYIRIRQGFLYLMAILDYVSRYVVGWSVSNSLESLFCVEALEEALRGSTPTIFHSDQGKQYTSGNFIRVLRDHEILISMSGKGRCFDNILAERLWRTVKYEEVYLREYGGGRDLIRSLRVYFEYYNEQRPHQALGYRTPGQVYRQRDGIDDLRLRSKAGQGVPLLRLSSASALRPSGPFGEADAEATKLQGLQGGLCG